VRKKVKECVSNGARVLYGEADGGKAQESTASTEETFYNPVVLTDVGSNNPGADTEIFGPVFTIMEACESAEECVQLSNSSRFGLGSAVFTDTTQSEEIARGEQVALQLDAGLSYVNDFVKSDPSMPFGGVKASGFGRECGSHGVHEFCNIKTVVVSKYAGKAKVDLEIPPYSK